MTISSRVISKKFIDKKVIEIKILFNYKNYNFIMTVVKKIFQKKFKIMIHIQEFYEFFFQIS